MANIARPPTIAPRIIRYATTAILACGVVVGTPLVASIGTDTQFQGPGQFQSYDYPNPIRPTCVVTWLDISTANGTRINWLLTQPASVTPVAPTDQPNPSSRRWIQTPQSRGRQYSTATSTNPFLAPNQPNPSRAGDRSLNHSFLHDRSLTLADQDKIYGGPGQPAWYQSAPNPLGYRFPIELRTGLGDCIRTTLAPLPATPAPNNDFPNPRGYAYSVSNRSYLDYYAVDEFSVNPFNQFDWPLPSGPPYPSTLRTYLWPFPQSLANQDLFFGAAGQGPAYDYPNPRGYVYPVELRTYLSVQTSSRGKEVLPFALFEWPVPKGRPIPLAIRTWLRALSLELKDQDAFFGGAGRGPFYDYPNPRGAVYPIDLRTFVLSLSNPPGPSVVVLVNGTTTCMLMMGIG